MGNAYLAKAFLRFLWASKNQHGVHSPFVFSLLTDCFYDTKPYDAYGRMRTYRQTLYANKDTIDVTDFGAGSRVFRTPTRQISAIARHAGISRARAEMLFRMSRYLDVVQVLEMGTSLGLGTQALALAVPKAPITTLEGCPQTALAARHYLKEYKNVSVIMGEFSQTISLWKPQPNGFKLVYFDGNHSEEATLSYVEMLLPQADEQTVWIFDDIHWSAQMSRAWQHIAALENVSVSIDLFRWGVVFFRPTQTKEHFVLRTPAIF